MLRSSITVGHLLFMSWRCVSAQRGGAKLAVVATLLETPVEILLVAVHPRIAWSPCARSSIRGCGGRGKVGLPFGIISLMRRTRSASTP